MRAVARVVMVISVAIAAVAVVMVVLIPIVQQDAKRDWDRGEDHPTAATLKLGETKRVPASVDSQPILGWHNCASRCHDAQIRRLPTVYPLTAKRLKGNCYVTQPTNRVPTISVAAQEGFRDLRVSFSDDAKEIRVCLGKEALQALSDGLLHEFFIIWSDHSTLG